MLENAVLTIRTLLPESGSVTREEISTQVDFVLTNPRFNGLDRNQLINKILSLYRIRIEEFRAIEDHERKRPWINQKKTSIPDNFWRRYKTYLQYKKNFAPETIDHLDRLTDRTLDGLYDPSLDVGFDKKGLVVGQVQSGKTSNYTGLICKAADAGYNFIIILAGLHNNLRTQTQIRVDEGFLGFDTKYQRAFNTGNSKIGAGVGHLIYPVHSFTSSDENGDFSKRGTYNFHTNEPIIAVVKKNKTRLENLYRWLMVHATDDGSGNKSIKDKALLLIDDEADNASINVSNDPEKRSAINKAITQILSLFAKSGYVGYTATPFANIFVPLDENDIFPRDFIINLPAPSNYVGPEKIFGFSLVEDETLSNDVLPIVFRIDDYESFVPDRHKSDDPLPSFLPESLKCAVRCFILTCAVRRVRGQLNEHNSMLIHVTRYVRWQNRIYELALNLFNYYRRGIDQNMSEILEDLRKTFEDDHPNYNSYRTITEKILNSDLSEIDNDLTVHTWSEVLGELNNAVSKIVVREVNGGSGDILNYFDHKEGLSVIAVGGDKLSRGLTLEGLSVSYYLRASKMYDTLMQMGRWFGYRPGYVDLCRLFTSRELNEWFCHITHASEELREEFEYMADIADSTPEKYALKVRTHPGVLQITASNKMKSTISIQVSWAGRLVESYELKKDINAIKNNLETTSRFLSSINKEFDKHKRFYLCDDVSPEFVIDFLNGFQLFDNLKAYDPAGLVRFINLQVSHGELTSWRVALMSKNNADSQFPIHFNNQINQIGCYYRLRDDKNSNDNIYYLRKSHIISPKDEFIDLTFDEYKKAEELTTKQWLSKKKEGNPKYPNGQIVRNEIRQPENPLLLIYLLDPSGAEAPEFTMPYVGFAISFPGSRHNKYLTYRINECLLDKFDFDDNFNDYEEDED